MNIINKFNADNKEIIIMGNLNMNYLKNDDHRNLKNNIAFLVLNQIVNKPTRVTKDSETLIDIILANRHGNLCSVNVILSSYSDHTIIGCKHKVNNIKYSDNIFSFRDYKIYDHTKINAELSSTDFAWNKIENILTKTIDNHAPIISKHNKSKQSPWIKERNELLRRSKTKISTNQSRARSQFL